MTVKDNYPPEAEIRNALIHWKLNNDSSRLEQILQCYRFADIKRAVNNILNMATDEFALDDFIALLPRLLQWIEKFGDPDTALNNWERFSRVWFDRSSLFLSLSQDENLLRFLTHLFSSSQFLTDTLIRNPEYFDWLIQENFLNRRRTKSELVSEFESSLKIFKDPERRRDALCRLRRRELLRIGSRDLLEVSSVEETTYELSELAEAILTVALKEIEIKMHNQYGEPQIHYSGETKKCEFVIIGMGKLGGQELNFSSDIDLIFVYEDEGETSGVTPGGKRVRKISNHQFFNQLTRELLQFLSKYTEEGRLYRCDVRLRPEGQAGPLARSLDSYANYFYSQARYWECVAYIKARPVTGDISLGKKFRHLVEEFIFYPRDPATLRAEIFSLKERIDYEIKERGLLYRDVKRGFGGIREIEFLVSTLQLLYVHQYPELNKSNTFQSIRALQKAGLLSAEDATFLIEAYSFLRKVEHMLQIVWETQTHLLPDDLQEVRKLARRLGYNTADSAEQFISHYRHITDRVHNLFLNFFIPSAPEEAETKSSEIFQLLNLNLPEEKVFNLLKPYRFSEPGSLQHLRHLFYGTREVYISASAQKKFELLFPRILEICKNLPQPDTAIRNFANFVSATKGAEALYSFIAEEQFVLQTLLSLFGTSDTMSQILITHPEFFEPLVEYLRECSLSLLESPEMGFHIFLPSFREEHLLPNLRRFKQFWTLLICICDVVNIIDTVQTPKVLTNLAEFILTQVLSHLVNQMEKKYGKPTDQEKGVPARLFVFALGGFGGYELNYFSDLDLVFVMDGSGNTSGPEQIENKLFFTKVADSVVNEMAGITPDGFLYKVDTRLRPDGASGELVCTTERLIHYYQEEAQLWELQSFLKARPIAPKNHQSETLKERINKIIQNRLSAISIKELQSHILDMRRRLEESIGQSFPEGTVDFKRGAGGLVDIEFAVQFLQLQYCSNSFELFVVNTIEAIRKLKQLDLLSESDANTLEENYHFLRLLESRLRLLQGKGTDILTLDSRNLEALRYAMQTFISSPEELHKKIKNTLKTNRELFSKILHT